MQRLAEFEEGHDGEGEWVKISQDFRRADFSCQWKRNVGKRIAYIAKYRWRQRRETCNS
jgi:hypothetical protein